MRAGAIVRNQAHRRSVRAPGRSPGLRAEPMERPCPGSRTAPSHAGRRPEHSGGCGASTRLPLRGQLRLERADRSDELASGATGFPFQSPDCAGDHLERGHLSSVRRPWRQRDAQPTARRGGGRLRSAARMAPASRDRRAATAAPAASLASISDSSHTPCRRARRCWNPSAPPRTARWNPRVRDFWPPARSAVAGPADFFVRARAVGSCPPPGSRSDAIAHRKRGAYHLLITCVSRFLAASLTRLLRPC